MKFFKVSAWIVVTALAAGLLAGCTAQVQEQDSLEFSYPAIRKARAKLREGDKQAALELLNKAIDEKPRMAQAHLEAAQLYDDYDRDYVRAIYHYERYLELRPQTEKREMIEGFIRKAKIAFAASVAEQVPGLDKKVQALQDENDRLKQDLQQVRSNLARCVTATLPSSSRSAARLSLPKSVPGTSLGRVSGSGGKPATQNLAADEPPVSEQAPDSAADAVTMPADKTGGTPYVVQRGDTLSAVAARVYHNPRKWKMIYDANRNTLGGSQKLKVGQVLIIPK
ncbi:MAG: LysM peptidoglycan-binding domain-containing protein [Kiritimatiellae bacterium]|nr:LysM peptidoglycan-binding domain-containing protein [Kiritimatiellia bacterium]